MTEPGRAARIAASVRSVDSRSGVVEALRRIRQVPPGDAGLDPSRVTTRRKKTFLFSKVKGVPDDVVVYAVTPA